MQETKLTDRDCFYEASKKKEMGWTRDEENGEKTQGYRKNGYALWKMNAS